MNARLGLPRPARARPVSGTARPDLLLPDLPERDRARRALLVSVPVPPVQPLHSLRYPARSRHSQLSPHLAQSSLHQLPSLGRVQFLK